MKYHIAAFLIGFIMDRLIGDPQGFPHPIRLIGGLIAALDKKLLNSDKKRKPGLEVFKGLLMWILVMLFTGLLCAAVLILFYRIHPFAGVFAEAVLTCYILAAKSLETESMKVYYPLDKGDIPGARHALSMIVGRDTDVLDEKGIERAVVETIAENTSDGIIAPLIYTFLGGPILGFLYKAVNTMDSMVGYRNDRYEYFGKIPAKLDDIWNFIPARLSAVFMIAAAFLGEGYSGKKALYIYKRDRKKHKSPNAAQTESVCAGALGLRLLGDASYFGKIVKKPFIGDAEREIEITDIKKAIRLMYMTEDVALLFLTFIFLIAELFIII